jgi:hypothetical protein
VTVRTVAAPQVDAPLEQRWQDEARADLYAMNLWRAVSAIGYRVQLDYAAAVHKARSIRQVTQVETVATTRQSAPEMGSGRCGGVLPPCYVMMRESRGDIHAENPTSSASGKWQFLDSTWAGFGGYARASHAPESVQDAKAAQLWAGGAGCSHWSAC